MAFMKQIKICFMEKKRCAKCKESKPVDNFYRSKQLADGFTSYCKGCTIAYNKGWRNGVPQRMETIRTQARQWSTDHPEAKRAYMKAYYQRHKRIVIDAYGPKGCACCGITQLEFLVIDHITGGGNAHRREIKTSSGTHFYLWLIRNNFPPGFRVLCHNCNFSYGTYDRCPHQAVAPADLTLQGDDALSEPEPT